MGISPAEFRARVGLYNARTACLSFSNHVAINNCSSGLGILSLHLSVVVLGLLLLISGIEPNPGPDHFKCKYCSISLDSVSSYFDHIQVHKFMKNFQIYCCFKDCNVSLSSLNSISSHVSRFHRTQIQVSQHTQQQSFTCPIGNCKTPLDSIKTFKAHMAVHLNKGEDFICPFSTCNTRLDTTSKLAVHLSRYHPGAPLPIQVTREPVTASTSFPSSVHSMEYEEFDNVELDCDVNIDPSGPSEVDPYPEFIVKQELARFYLKLEGHFLLPTSTVQAIAEQIKMFSELSHHCLKKALHHQLLEIGLKGEVIFAVVKKTFKNDPVFNTHHKDEDLEQLGTNHLRQKFWKKNFPYVEPKEIYLGTNERGKKRNAHYISIRESLETLLKDKKIKLLVLNSFKKSDGDTVLKDYTDGSAYKAHRKQHSNGKCLQLLLFQDALEFNPFGPAKGLFKPSPFYYSLGNLPPEYRSKVDLIQLAYMVLENDLKPSKAEDLNDHDKMKAVLKCLLDELEELKLNGIEIDGEKIPVCLLFSLGDNLGQHQLGSFVKSFSAAFWCRFCPISKTQFHDDPSQSPPLRTPEDYDDCVRKAKRKWVSTLKKITQAKKIRKNAEKRSAKLSSRCTAPGTKTIVADLISKSAYTNLCAINFRGVKFRPSPLNSEVLGFHVCAPALPPCLAHDLFEGIVKVVLAKILKYFICTKKWFDLTCLNRRIKSFKCKGSDARDAPTPLKNLDELSGNACENWNLLRLLPFIIGDLILDKGDEMWQLYLSLKEICEFVCAPEISLEQVAYLQDLIQNYLESIKNLLPLCLTPKHHYLGHYPTLITIFGPLLRLFTLRFESVHVFFKNVVRACKNYINITSTLARKYMSRFAFDHSSGILPNDVIFNSNLSVELYQNSIPEDKRSVFPVHFNVNDYVAVDCVTVKGIEYKKGYFLIFSLADAVDLNVGCIDMIIVSSTNEVSLLFEEKVALNSFNGYYIVQETPRKKHSLKLLSILPDVYPLSAYEFQSRNCLSLKHSLVCMI